MRPPTIPTTIPMQRDSDTKQTLIMKTLYNTLINYKEPKTHRILIQVFMCLPSRKDFPEYFNIIERPISMNKIRDRIEKQQYIDEAACMEDFKLMFSNCKFFNEDDSQIYKDALTLENLLIQRREQLLNEYNASSNDNNDLVDDNNKFTTNNIGSQDKHINNNDGLADTDNNDIRCNKNNNVNNSTPSTPTFRSERLNSTYRSGSNINNRQSIKNEDFKQTSNPSTPNHHLASPSKRNNNNNHSNSTSYLNNSSNNSNINNPSDDDQNTTLDQQHDIGKNHLNNNSSSSPRKVNNNINNNTTSSNVTTSSTDIKLNNNGLINDSNDSDTQQSGSNISSNKADLLTNGKNDATSEDSGFNIIQNNHTDISMDSTSNLSSDLLASTPIEKCSLNNRRGRNSEAPKRQLLTGYIIYASEIRKDVIDRNPNQNFGDISRLVGNEWKALPRDIRSKYDQRALIHNKRVREKAQRDLQNPDPSRLSNGFHSPKLTKRKLAKIAKEQMRQHHLLNKTGDLNDSLTPAKMDCDRSRSPTLAPSSSQFNGAESHQSHLHRHHLPQKPSHQYLPSHHQTPTGRPITSETATQTTAIRFVEPTSTTKRLSYSETFRKYIEGLRVPNEDQLNEELGSKRKPDNPSQWLGGGIGRHQSPQAALWALRDFMLQDSVTMRRNLQPYL